MYWAQYRRTFVPVQAFILVATLLFVYVGHVSWGNVVGPLVVMEAAAIYGARQAARMKVSLTGERPMVRPPADR